MYIIKYIPCMGTTPLECLMNLINFGRLNIFIQNISGIINVFACVTNVKGRTSGKWLTTSKTGF